MAESKATDAGQAEVQARYDKGQEQGFLGAEVDQTPNENYTLPGVLKDKPTPETDAKQAEKATATTTASGGGSK
jgi:hypothetical protein